MEIRGCVKQMIVVLCTVGVMAAVSCTREVNAYVISNHKDAFWVQVDDDYAYKTHTIEIDSGGKKQEYLMYIGPIYGDMYKDRIPVVVKKGDLLKVRMNYVVISSDRNQGDVYALLKTKLDYRDYHMPPEEEPKNIEEEREYFSGRLLDEGFVQILYTSKYLGLTCDEQDGKAYTVCYPIEVFRVKSCDVDTYLKKPYIEVRCRYDD